ncbi:LysR family transcriptional regulator [Rhizobium acidisoli]|uniref:LysR family transcriptional regulator n=1 Tax=Rhizobium acidisoli TaxID=1538158 RepID=A0AAE5TXR8_9HYPH|nr:LysR substrate-binding domain-containing protein [Rhizobium acidisoli]KPH06084.1 transcriptional regulator [Rhizobium acidisoli]QAS78521.1 LysR family transcriptional regulator [Rhizobium acidisoli]
MRRLLPSLSALHAFEAAARYLSFTRAAEELGITQSGISRQIKNLEEFLGLTLFHRSGPRLVLTELGAAYYRDVSLTLDKLQEVSMDAVRGRSIDTSLILGTHPTLASRWLPMMLGSFIDRHPNIPIEVQCADTNLDFETTRLDIAILRGVGSWLHARCFKLLNEELVVVASPKLIPPGTQCSPTDISDYIQLQNAGQPSLWMHWLRLSKVNYNGRLQGPRFAYFDMIINGAINGLGIALVPSFYVRQEIECGTLHMPFGAPIASGEAYFLVYPERKSHQPSIGVFRDWLLKEMRLSRHSTDNARFYCQRRPVQASE